jgi:hypothetical protein
VTATDRAAAVAALGGFAVRRPVGAKGGAPCR